MASSWPVHAVRTRAYVGRTIRSSHYAARESRGAFVRVTTFRRRTLLRRVPPRSPSIGAGHLDRPGTGLRCRPCRAAHCPRTVTRSRSSPTGIDVEAIAVTKSETDRGAAVARLATLVPPTRVDLVDEVMTRIGTRKADRKDWPPYSLVCELVAQAKAVHLGEVKLRGAQRRDRGGGGLQRTRCRPAARSTGSSGTASSSATSRRSRSSAKHVDLSTLVEEDEPGRAAPTSGWWVSAWTSRSTRRMASTVTKTARAMPWAVRAPARSSADGWGKRDLVRPGRLALAGGGATATTAAAHGPVQERLQEVDQRVKRKGYGDSGGPRRPEG